MELCSPQPPCSGFPTQRSLRLGEGGGGGGLVAGVRVGRPVGVLPPWAVIAVAAPWPMGTQPPLATQALNCESFFASTANKIYASDN